MDPEKLLAVCRKLRLIEDCLRRALDQLDGETCNEPETRYVKDQVERADDFLTDVICTVLAAPGFIA